MGPLAGYRVLDFGWVMAGPILGHILADFGADVIKVESRRRLDASRRGRPLTGERIAAGDRGEEPDLVPLYHSVNRGKRSITVDLTHPEGPPLMRELVRSCDVVVENFSPRVLPKFGLDYPRLREVRPDLVMVSLSAAGQDGPLADIVAYAPTVSSLAGYEGLLGYDGQRVLGMMGLAFSDAIAGLLGAYAVLVALYHRERTGEGQHIDFSQLEAVASLAGEPLLDAILNGRAAGPQGNSHPVSAPHNMYPCQGDDAWVAIAVTSEVEWAALCAAMERPGLRDDTRFADAYLRRQHLAELDTLIRAWTRERTPSEVTERLQAAGVAAMPVLNIEGQFFDPHLRARGVYVEVEHPLIGTEPLYGLPWKLSETPGAVERPAPLLGEHTDEVLSTLLGLSPAEILQLRERQVLY